MVESINRLFQSLPFFAKSSKKLLWESAQEYESGFWDSVAVHGYMGHPPEQFLSENQRRFMLAQMEHLGKPLSFWADKTVVEFGSGPAGLVEYLQARPGLPLNRSSSTTARHFHILPKARSNITPARRKTPGRSPGKLPTWSSASTSWTTPITPRR